MSKSKTPMYLGLAAVGAGGFYLYRAGGDPKSATKDMKSELLPWISSLYPRGYIEKQAC